MSCRSHVDGTSPNFGCEESDAISRAVYPKIHAPDRSPSGFLGLPALRSSIVKHDQDPACRLRASRHDACVRSRTVAIVPFARRYFLQSPYEGVENLFPSPPIPQTGSSDTVNSTEWPLFPLRVVEDAHVKFMLTLFVPCRSDRASLALLCRKSTRFARVFLFPARSSTFSACQRGCITSRGKQRALEVRERDEASDATCNQRLLCEARGLDPAARRW